MRLRLAIVAACALLLSVAVWASARAQTASPKEQALTQELIQSINNNITCKTDVVTLQQEIQKLRAELAKTKKPEKKHEPGKKKP